MLRGSIHHAMYMLDATQSRSLLPMSGGGFVTKGYGDRNWSAGCIVQSQYGSTGGVGLTWSTLQRKRHSHETDERSALTHHPCALCAAGSRRGQLRQAAVDLM